MKYTAHHTAGVLLDARLNDIDDDIYSGAIALVTLIAMKITITKTSILIIYPVPKDLLLTYPISPPPPWFFSKNGFITHPHGQRPPNSFLDL